jgi:type IV pilus assembly protein PilO
MTAGGDFIPNEPNYETGPNYPVVFGVALTPTISGILLALLGLGVAGYILLNLVQPELAKRQDLSAKVQDKENQIQQQQAIAAQTEQAKKDLDTAKKQRDDVLSLFATDSSMNTLLLDINRQIDARNAGLQKAQQDKLAACPAWVKNNLADVQREVGDLVVKSSLKKFTPVTDPKVSGVINDNSYGSLVNGKLKREVTQVSFEGNFAQTQAILRSIEQLQPLLVLKNVEFVVGDGNTSKPPGRLYELRGNSVQPLANCQPETKITTSFQVEALMPLSPEEQAATAPANAPKK